MEELTLHVGAGTFKPVKSAEIEGHEMHTEYISVSRGTIENLIVHNGKAIAVGTTSVRTLESLYHIGVTLLKIRMQQKKNFMFINGSLMRQLKRLQVSHL